VLLGMGSLRRCPPGEAVSLWPGLNVPKWTKLRIERFVTTALILDGIVAPSR
jgi:hypothetical protein